MAIACVGEAVADGWLQALEYSGAAAWTAHLETRRSER